MEDNIPITELSEMCKSSRKPCFISICFSLFQSSIGVDMTSTIIFSDGNFHDYEVDRVVPPVVNAVQHAESEQLPFIIWWTPFSTDEGKIKRCWTGDCLFTTNKSFYSHALTKAFLFYATDLNISNLPLPRKGTI